MKDIILRLSALVLIVTATACGSKYVQGTAPTDPADVKNLIETQQYAFRAQTVLPSGGPSRQLTSDYDMRISKNSVVTYLPYFGRAYAAPIDPSKGGIDFTSTDFQYKKTDRKKGGWNIQIIPKDAGDVRELILQVFDNGTANLRVISNNRQSISYQGFIKNLDQEKSK